MDKVVDALSTPSNIDALIDVPALKGLVDTHTVSIEKLVDAHSKVSPGDEDNLWDVKGLATRLATNEALDVTQGNTLVTLTNRLDANDAKDTAQDTALGSLGTRATDIEGVNTAQGTSLTSLDTRVTSTETAISGTGGLVSRASALEGRATAVEGRATMLEGRATTIEDKNTNQDNAISGINTRVGTLETRATSIEGVNTAQGTSLTSLDTRMTSAETAISGTGGLVSRASALEGRATAVEGRATTLEGKVGALETRATNIEGKNTNQDTTISGINTRVGALETRATNIEGVNTDQGTSLTSLGTRMTNAETAISGTGGLVSRASALEGRATALEGRATTVEGRATTLDGKVGALETRATNIEGKNTNQDTTISGINTRVGALETRATNIEGVNTDQGTSLTSLGTRTSKVESDATTLMARVATNEGTLNLRISNLNAEMNLVDSPDFFGDLSTWVHRDFYFVNVPWHDGRIIRAQQSKESGTGCVCTFASHFPFAFHLSTLLSDCFIVIHLDICFFHFQSAFWICSVPLLTSFSTLAGCIPTCSPSIRLAPTRFGVPQHICFLNCPVLDLDSRIQHCHPPIVWFSPPVFPSLSLLALASMSSMPTRIISMATGFVICLLSLHAVIALRTTLTSREDPATQPSSLITLQKLILCDPNSWRQHTGYLMSRATSTSAVYEFVYPLSHAALK
jgi:uncharacterized coiled-coil protein SlyX